MLKHPEPLVGYATENGHCYSTGVHGHKVLAMALLINGI